MITHHAKTRGHREYWSIKVNGKTYKYDTLAVAMMASATGIY